MIVTRESLFQLHDIRPSTDLVGSERLPSDVDVELAVRFVIIGRLELGVPVIAGILDDGAAAPKSVDHDFDLAPFDRIAERWIQDGGDSIRVYAIEVNISYRIRPSA